MISIDQLISNHIDKTKVAFKKVAEILKMHKARIGDPSTLNTLEKSDLTKAINEVNAKVTSVNNLSINDDTASSTDVYSSAKLEDYVEVENNKVIAKLLGGASPEIDTLKEVGDKVASLAQTDEGLLSANQAQSFSDEQKVQARANIDVYSKAEIGDWSTVIIPDFVAEINTVYNA